MGPMMPAFGGMVFFALMMLVFLLLLIVIIGVIASAVWRRGAPSGTAMHMSSPADLLRMRYASGEITREQYRQSLLDLLHDRYARDEISLEELEERTQRLVSD